ncbi:MAG: hypothetical protein AAFN93_28550, partial [Bacteroidota bacterium]
RVIPVVKWNIWIVKRIIFISEFLINLFRNNSDEEIADGTEGIKSKGDFVEFLKNFRTYIEDWENSNLVDFLEALQAYAVDVEDYYKNLNFRRKPEEASWRVFAQLLNGARSMSESAR